MNSTLLIILVYIAWYIVSRPIGVIVLTLAGANYDDHNDIWAFHLSLVPIIGEFFFIVLLVTGIATIWIDILSSIVEMFYKKTKNWMNKRKIRRTEATLKALREKNSEKPQPQSNDKIEIKEIHL